MVFNDSTGGQGIVQDAYFLIQADANSYPIADVTRNSNRAYDEAVSIILKADGRWEYDDTNATDLPIATTPLVANQPDYSFDSSFLIVERVEVQDQNGAWRALLPISQADVVRDGSSLTDFLKDAGIPQYYDKTANSVFLYPRASYSQPASLKVFFKRNINYFTTTDTTKTPGFAANFHRYISLSDAIDYATAKSLPQLNSLLSQKQMISENMADFYTRRSNDENLHIGGRRWKFF